MPIEWVYFQGFSGTRVWERMRLKRIKLNKTLHCIREKKVMVLDLEKLIRTLMRLKLQHILVFYDGK